MKNIEVLFRWNEIVFPGNEIKNKNADVLITHDLANVFYPTS